MDLRDVVCAPQEDALVLRACTDVPPVRREAGLDLAGEVGVSLVLAHHAEVPQVVQPDPAVVAGYQNPVLRGHGLYPSHLPTSAVLTAGTLDVDGGVVLQLVGGEEYDSAVIRPNNNKFT